MKRRFNKKSAPRRGGKKNSFTKREKSHWKQYGEQHPVDDTSLNKKSTKVLREEKIVERKQQYVKAHESDSANSEDENPYNELLHLFGSKNEKHSVLSESSEEEEEEEEEIEIPAKKRKKSENAKLSTSKKANSTSLDSDDAAESESLDSDAEVASDIKDSQGDSASEASDNDDAHEGNEVDNADNGDGSEDEDVAHSSANDDDDDDQRLNVDDYRHEDYNINDEEEGDGELALSIHKDPFVRRFETELDENKVPIISDAKTWLREDIKLPILGSCTLTRPSNIDKSDINVHEKDLKKLAVKHILCGSSLVTTNKKNGVLLHSNDNLTQLQRVLFGVLNSYQDLLYPDRNSSNKEEIRLVCCLHALNHVLKTRARVVSHGAKLKTTRRQDVDTDEYRDQGLTRPKVVMVVPFRESALRIVKMMASLMTADQNESKTFITNKKRFLEEYGTNSDEPVKGNKPADFKETFAGNIDDHFRLGIGVAKKSLKLYTEFYSSDIIIASPLGLRSVIGAEGDKERDFDFLSSIEVLIFDQTDVFLMQNWDHVLHLMKHLHLQPLSPHGTDFSRVRMWTLNGWSKLYRQTIVISSMLLPEISALFNKYCHNYAGKLCAPKNNTIESVSQVVVQLPQVFRRVEATSFADLSNARFQHFVTKVLKEFRDKGLKHVMIFLPSYFDFVRLRNYLRKEEVQSVHICEYSKEKSISRARTFFFHGETQFLLYTERTHFYRRFQIRGVKHIIFYDLPIYSHFYSELCNMLADSQRSSEDDVQSCTVLYSRFDVLKLSAIVGMERASRMINSDKQIHMIVSGD